MKFVIALSLLLVSIQSSADCTCTASLESKQYLKTWERRSYVWPIGKLTFKKFSCSYTCDTPTGIKKVTATHTVKFRQETGNEVICDGVKMSSQSLPEFPWIRYYNPQARRFDPASSSWQSLKQWSRQNCSTSVSSMPTSGQPFNYGSMGSGVN